MAVFNLPKTHDDFFTLQFMIFFLISFFLNAFSNGQATIIFLEDEYSVGIGHDLEVLDQKTAMLEKYSKDLFDANSVYWWVVFSLYFGVSPLINFYYGFFIFRKGQWKDLKSLKI